MKKHIQFKYYKPRRDSATFDIIDTEEIYSKQIIITEMQRKTAQRNVPIMAKIYPETFFNLALAKGELKIPSLVEIALYLVMKLDTKNNQKIKVQNREIESDLKISDKTVTKALNYLEEQNLIVLLKRGEYFLSPKLGFFGEPDSWSIAIEYEQEGMEKVRELINYYDSKEEEIKKEHTANQAITDKQDAIKEQRLAEMRAEIAQLEAEGKL